MKAKYTIHNAIRILTAPTAALALVAFISFFALAMAFIAEGFLGLEPCRLCIYQRYPFALAGIAALIGLTFRKNPNISGLFLALCALFFASNTGIAAYHTGVERHWWKSAFEECTINFDTGNKNFLENILSAPTAPCDQIPWADPILGLSMANYNVVMCLALLLFCAFAALRIRKYQAGS